MEANNEASVAIPRRKRRRFVLLLITLVLLYTTSYAILSITGGWITEESGEIRMLGFAVADVYQWQPRYGHCKIFRTATGKHVWRGDALGLFYTPLILFDQRLVHRTIRFIPLDPQLSDSHQAPPLSEFHPLKANDFHGRNRY